MFNAAFKLCVEPPDIWLRFGDLCDDEVMGPFLFFICVGVDFFIERSLFRAALMFVTSPSWRIVAFIYKTKRGRYLLLTWLFAKIIILFEIIMLQSNCILFLMHLRWFN